MPRKGDKPIPPGVKEAVKREAAARKKGAVGLAKEMSDSYGISLRQAKRILNDHRDQIDDMRGRVGEVAMVLVGQGLSRIAEDLSNDKKMAVTPMKDKAMTVEKLTNTAITAIEGHKPMVTLNISNARTLEAEIAARDARMKQIQERKKAIAT